MIHKFRNLIMVAVCLCITTPRLFSQTGVAYLSGIVTDSSQSVVPGVKVTAVNHATGLSRTTSTDTSGNYGFSSLPIGSYEITAALAGFTESRQTVMVDPSAKLRLDF